MARHFTRVLYFHSPSAHENINTLVNYLAIFHSDSDIYINDIHGGCGHF